MMMLSQRKDEAERWAREFTSESLRFDVEREELVVTVPERLVLENRLGFRQALDTALTSTLAGAVVLYFGRTAYVDSAGLGALMMVRRRCIEGGHALRLEGMHDDLDRLFRAVGLTGVDA